MTKPNLVFIHRNFFIAVVLLLILGTIIFLTCLNIQEPNSIDTSLNSSLDSTSVNAPAEEVILTLTGDTIPKREALDRIVSVIVENHPDSRPQSGLSDAEIVFEMVAEGGITRNLAIFQKGGIRVGPIRSARTYFTEIANSFGGVFAHVGGSPEALSGLSSGKYGNLKDTNEFFQSDLFERVKTRRAPHNVYSQTEILAEQGKDSVIGRVSQEGLGGLHFISKSIVSASPVENIAIDFSKPEFLTQYSFDSQSGRYFRTTAGEISRDENTNEQIAPTTLIILETDISNIQDDKEGRVRIRTTGTGKALFFNSGSVMEGTWSRKVNGNIVFAREDGGPVNLTSGQIWISVLDSLLQVRYP